MTRQPLLIESWRWEHDQPGLFDAQEREQPGPAPAATRTPTDRDQYSAGYRDGMDGRKGKGEHPDYLRGHADGSADKRYNARCNQHVKTFRGWAELPGQTNFAE